MKLPASGRVVAALAAGICGLLPASAGAACQIRGLVGLNFVNYLSTSALPLDTQGSIAFRCDAQLTPMTIDLSPGGATSALSRRMVGPSSATLNYNLYLDVTRLVIWGNGLSGTSHYGPLIPLLGSDVTLPVYGRIPAGQTVPAGSYSDTIVVTLTF
ncbi:spore coat U domain-containing protein [Myxococcus sp. K15C18031901]|uniref:Csu type fimbrial protein n=1 Tax=Myxococcus dinghuensis TaxID=2906761 RepID=UPI0020A79E2A|nr:spore coat U domain-containing protein [Myxococcus dinghuensis]MCP3101382.1 spore coat U domain-containing protein [Myxococcus dinghuensis]